MIPPHVKYVRMYVCIINSFFPKKRHFHAHGDGGAMPNIHRIKNVDEEEED